MKHGKKTHADEAARPGPNDGAAPAGAVEPPGEGPAPAPAAGTESHHVDELRRKLAALEDDHLRLRADFDNYRKRMSRERDETVRRTREDLLHDLLPVIDNLERSLAASASRGVDAAFIEGQRLLLDQWFRLTEKYGLKSVEAVGKPFDPQVHEAIQHIASEQHPPGTVISETRRGYRAGERLLRPAQVVVSSGGSASEADGASETRRKETGGGGKA